MSRSWSLSVFIAALAFLAVSTEAQTPLGDLSSGTFSSAGTSVGSHSFPRRLQVEILPADSLHPLMSDDLVVFHRSEETSGEDANDDGDLEDLVLHVYERDSGDTYSLGWALPSGDGVLDSYVVSGTHVLAFVSELEQGELDLNDDNDLDDRVLHWFDMETGRRDNLGLAGEAYGESLLGEGELVAFLLSEADQSHDASGDGDLDDQVLFLVDLGAETLVNTGLCSRGLPRMVIDGTHVIMRVHEACYGPLGFDLTEDGDADDAVAVDYDTATGTYVTPRMAMTEGNAHALIPSAAGFYFFAPEGPSGIDKNLDGDFFDDVLQHYDRSSGLTVNWTVALRDDPVVVGSRAALLVPEWANGGVDLNLDGDAMDLVIHVIDLEAGTIANLQLGVTGAEPREDWIALDEERLVFCVHEGIQGADLNGDTDLLDSIVHSYEFATTKVTNHLLRTEGHFRRSGDVVLLPLSEYVDYVDLDGDGDANDFVLHSLDLSTGLVVNHRLAVDNEERVHIVGEHFVAAVAEGNAAGADLNGDGDSDDVVLTIRRLDGGRTLHSGWSGHLLPHPYLRTDDPARERHLLFEVSEAEQGGIDLNDDGDAEDRVLALGRIR